MAASSKRASRVKRREQIAKETGLEKKAKKFDTSKESNVIQCELGNRKKFHEHDLCTLQPKSVRQEKFLRLFYDNIPLLVASGSAGTGKSFLALYCALSEVFREDTPQEKIILVRSAVQTRDIGYLPGEATGSDSKSAPFEQIYHPMCHTLMPKYKDAYNHLKTLGYLEFHLTSFLRGATFDRAIVVVDEAACMNYHELKTITERLGHNSRLIVCGDVTQDDLHSKGKKNDQSGMGEYLDVVERMPSGMVGVVEYTVDDIVRSGLVKQFLIADQS